MKNSPSQEKRSRGRPRAFCRDAALDAAMRLFWLRGYDATSISALTDAMGVTPPQLYAAFGDKRRLFAEAIDKYQAEKGAFSAAALGRPSAREAIGALLRNAARELTALGQPAGCLCVLGAVNCAPGSAGVEADLRRRRAEGEAAMRRRIESGREAGELPAGTDGAALAKFYAGVLQGMSIQARDGATRPELERVADSAMAAWPA